MTTGGCNNAPLCMMDSAERRPGASAGLTSETLSAFCMKNTPGGESLDAVFSNYQTDGHPQKETIQIRLVSPNL